MVNKIEQKISEFNEMINQCFENHPDNNILRKYKIDFSQILIHKFDIGDIYNQITQLNYNTENLHLINNYLKDIKLLLYYLKISHHNFLFGATLIVGNKEYEKADFKTLSLLQWDHYRVYIISLLYEKLLTLFYVLSESKIPKIKKGKWGILFGSINKTILSELKFGKKHKVMCEFYEDYRNYDTHDITETFRFLEKDRWNHFKAEEAIIDELINELIKKIYYCGFRKAKRVGKI